MLVEKKTDKKVAQMRYVEEKDQIYLGWIEAIPQNEGYGTRLIRLLQFIAKHDNKPIMLDAVADAIEFFKRNGFVVTVELDEFGLAEMRWTPKHLLNTSG